MKSKLSVDTVQARQRENDALAMRIAGHHFGKIAEAVGYADASGAHRAVSRGLARVQNGILENAEELRRIEIARLERLLTALDPAIEAGEPAAINSAVRLSESLRKLLGLDAPQRTELTGAGGGPVVVTDLGSLSEEELSAYERLCERVSARAGQPGEAKPTA